MLVRSLVHRLEVSCLGLLLLPLSGAPCRGQSPPAQVPVASPVSPDMQPITITAVGDVMLGSTFPDSSRMPPDDAAGLLSPFSSQLHGADIVFGNLEGPMLEGGTSAKCAGPHGTTRSNCYAFRMPVRFGQVLKDAGFTVMSVANNHAGDFGAEGRQSTRETLDSAGIRHVGSDRGRFASTVLEVRGRKIGVIGFAFNEISPSINEIPAARKLVEQLRRSTDIVIVSFHGGGEGTGFQHVKPGMELFFGEPRGDLREFTHAVIDAGAALVLGHGPHVLRGMEVYKDRLIVYSMGNFCTYGWFHLQAETALTAVFSITLQPDGRFLNGVLTAGTQSPVGGPVEDESGQAVRLLRTLSEADFGPHAPQIQDDGSFAPRGTLSSTE